MYFYGDGWKMFRKIFVHTRRKYHNHHNHNDKKGTIPPKPEEINVFRVLGVMAFTVAGVSLGVKLGIIIAKKFNCMLAGLCDDDNDDDD